MKTRLLLIVLLTLFLQEVRAQVKSPLQSLRKVTLFSHNPLLLSGNSSVKGELIAPAVETAKYGKTLPVTTKLKSQQQTQAQVNRLYAELASTKPTATLDGKNLSGATLAPGVYHIKGSALLKGTLTLQGTGQKDELYIFKVEGNLILSPSAQVKLSKRLRSRNVVWVVNGNVKLNAQSTLKGSILAKGDINAEHGAQVEGKLLSQEGSVSLLDSFASDPAAAIADLTISQTVSPAASPDGKYVVNDVVTYTVTVTNTGPDNEEGVEVNFGWLPNNALVFISATQTTGTYNAADGYWEIPVLPVGQVETLEVTVRLNRANFITTATDVSGTGIDVDLDNSSSTLIICPVNKKPAGITGPEFACVLQAGVTDPYTFTVDQPIPGARYSWDLPPGWTAIGPNNASSIIVTTGTTPGTQTISARADSPCGLSDSTSFNVYLYPSKPTIAGPISGNSTYCVGSQETFSIPSGTQAKDYIWTVPADWTIITNDSSEQITVQFGPTSGKIRVVANNPCGNSAAIEKDITVILSVLPAPGGITASNDILCANTGTVTYSINSVAGAIDYTWSVPTSWAVLSGQGTTSITLQVGAPSDSIFVVANNICGPSSPRVKKIIVSPAAPQIGSINGDLTICSSDPPQTYSVDPVANALTYFWEVPTGWSILSGQGGTNVSVKQGTSGGLLKLTVTNGCGQDVKTINIEVSNSRPAAPVFVPTSPEALAPCIGQTGLVYSVNSVPGAQSYDWELPDGWVITNRSNGGRTITATSSSTPGQITIKAENGCGFSTATSISVVPFGSAPDAPVNFLGDLTPCAGSIITYQIENPIAGLFYDWFVPAGWAIQNGDSTSMITVLVGSNAGIISVKAGNGCGPSPSALEKPVTPFNGVPVFSSEIITPGLICAGVPEIVYSINAATGARSYQWTVPSGWTIKSGHGSNAIVVTPGSTGGQVTVTAENTCGNSLPKSVNQVVSPAAPTTPSAITGSAIICQGQTTTYTANASANATSYVWTIPADWTVVSGGNTREITVATGSISGNLTVQAVNSCGTSSATSFNVQVVPSALSAGPITDIDEVCGTTSIQTYSIAPVAGATGYTWTLPNGWTLLSANNGPSVQVRVGATGTISVTVQNQCGSGTASTRTTTVRTEPPAAPIAINADPSARFPCENQAGLTYSVAPVTDASNYIWSVPSGWTIVGSQTGPSINVTAGVGAGQVRVFTRNACGDSAPIAINVATAGTAPSLPEAVEGDPVPCIGATGKIYSVRNAVAGVQYNWSVPANWVVTAGLGTSQITVTIGSDTGNVEVTAENGCGITAATSLAVAPTTGPPAIGGDITGEDDVCLGAVLTYRVPAGGAISSYTWSTPSGWDITAGQGTNEITVKVNAVISGKVLVTAVNGCGNSVTKELLVISSPNIPEVPPVITGPTDLCIGSQYTFLASPVDNATGYQWNIPAGWTIVSGQGTGTLVVTIGSTSGEISVLKSKATNGCGGSEETVFNTTVNPNAPGVVGAISGPDRLCATNTVQEYSVTPVPFATNYFWTVPAGWQIVSGQTGSTLRVIPGTQSGEVRLRTSNACGNNAADGTLAVIITGSAPLRPAAIAGSAFAANPCVGQPGLTYTIPAVSGATSYKWEVPSGWAITAGQNTTSITVTAGSLPGDISVMANNLCGDSPARTFGVTPFTEPPATPAGITGAQRPCVGSQVTYRVVSPQPNVNYNWSVPTGWSVSSGQGTAEVVITIGTIPGSVEVKAENGCGESAGAILPITPSSGVPVLAGNISGAGIICAGATGLVYTVPVVATAESYQWTLPDGWSITAGSETNSITVTAGTGSGTISVAGINACGTGVAKTLAVTATLGAPQSPIAISGPTSLCIGGGPVTYSIAAVANASSYDWTYPVGWTVLNGQGTLSITLQPNGTSGAVAVAATNVCGTATGTTNVTIFPNAPDAAGSISGPVSYCADNTEYTYSITPVAGATTYNWTIPVGWTLVSGEGTTSIVVRPSTNSGSISVAGVNVCGEGIASSQAITITGVKPIQPGAISGNPLPCRGTTVTYSIAAVTGATGYVWEVPAGWTLESGQNSTSITVTTGLGTGNVTVKAVSVCGESPVRTQTVTSSTFPPVQPEAIVGQELPCANSQNITYSVRNPIADMTYTWSLPAGITIVSGQGTADLVVNVGTSGGEITVTATNGCGTSPAASLTVAPTSGSPALTSNIAGQGNVCAGSSYTYSVSGTNASSFEWSVPTGWLVTAGAGTNTITVTAGSLPGNVVVAAENGCAISPSRTLAVSVLPAAPQTPGTISGVVNACANLEVTYEVAAVANATSYIWTVPAEATILAGGTSRSITVRLGNASGQVTVKAVNSCGTSAESILNINVSPGAPEPVGPIAGASAFCATAATQTYSIATVARATNYSWSFPTGWTIISGQGTTTVEVQPGTTGGVATITASNGCGQTSRTMSITVNQAIASAPTGLTGKLTPCIGETGLTYSVPFIAGATGYTWTMPADWTIQSGQGTRSITLTAGSLSGAITVTANNDCGASPAASLTVTPSGTAPTQPSGISNASVICANSQQVFSVDNPQSGLTYNWNYPANWTLVSGQGTAQITLTVSGSSGTVSVAAQNTCGNSPVLSKPVTVTSDAPALAGNISGTSSGFCQGTTQTYTVPVSASASAITWTVPAGWSILSGQGTASVQVNVGNSGSISVSALNGCGQTTSRSLAVTVAPALPVAIGPIAGDIESCTNEVQTYSIPALAGATSYTWQVPLTANIQAGQGTNSITVRMGTVSGEVLVSVTDICGNTRVAKINVELSQVAPSPISAISGVTTICSTDASRTYSISPVANAKSLTWSIPTGWTLLSGQGSTSITVKPNTQSGTLSVEAWNYCGTSTQSLAVTVNGPISTTPGAISGKPMPCENEVVTYSIAAVAGATGYNWTVPAGWSIIGTATSTSIQVKAGGTTGSITVVASNDCGNSPAASLVVSPSGSVPARPDGINGMAQICGVTGNTYKVINPVAGVTYTWTLPAGWTFISNAGLIIEVDITGGPGPGNLTLVASNACGASEPFVLAVTASRPPILTGIQGTDVLCANAGQLTYSVNATVAGDTYAWSFPAGWNIVSGQGTAQVTVTPGPTSGVISVVGTNMCGTTTSTKNVVVSPAPPTDPGPITGLDEYCSSSATYTYSVQPVAGVTGYTWAVPAGWTLVSGQGTNQVTIRPGLTSGLISVKTLNGCGESNGAASRFVSITGQTPEAPDAITGTTAPCIGLGNVVYATNAVAGATSYVWSVPATWTIVSGQGTTSLTVTPGSTAGNVSVKATSASCGDSPVTTLAVTPFSNPPAIPQSITGPAAPCTNAVATYAVVNPVAGLTYNWSVPTGWTITSGAGTASVQVTVGSVTGQVTVSASNACGTGTAVNLQVTPTTGVIALNPITGPASVCPAATPLTYAVTSTAGITNYQWTVPTGWTLLSGQGTTQITVTAPTSGSGNLVVTGVNQCGTTVSRSLVVIITSGAPLPMQAINGPATVCENGEYTYSVPVIAGATTYTWTIPAGATFVNGQGTSAITVKMGASAGSVSVVASNNCSTSPVATLAINQPGTRPSAVGAISGTSIICSTSASQTYSIAAVAGAAGYTWTVPTGWTITGGQGSRSINVVPGTVSGTVKVEAINTCGTTTNTLAVTVAQPLAALPAIDGNEVPCENETNVTYSISAVPGATGYTWSVPNGWVIQSGQNSPAIIVTAGTSIGQITVKATNACGDSPISSLAVTPSQAAPTTPTGVLGQVAPCGNSQGLIYSVVNPVEGIAYTWTLPAGWSIVSGQNSPTIEVNTSTNAGNILVTASNGCGTSPAFAFAVAPNAGTPAITGALSGQTSVCGGTTSLVYAVNGVAGATYNWTVPTGWTIRSGQNTPSITVDAGTLDGTITVEGSNGCGTIARTLAVTIQDPITETLSAIAGKQAPCSGEENLTYTVNAVTGATGYTWSVPFGWTIVSGSTSNAITVKAGNSAGFIRVFASNSCGDTPAVELQVTPAAVPVPAGILGNTTVCANAQQVQYAVQNPVAGITYTWFVPGGWNIVSGQGTAQVQVNAGTASGTIAVTATNTCGTSAAATVAVAIGQAPVLASEIQGAATVCANATGLTYSMAASAAAATYTWSVPAGWSIISGQGGTQITVQAGTTEGDISVIASNGCGTSTKVLAVKLNSAVVATPGAITGITTTCPGTNNLVYTVPAVNGATSYTWTVPAGWTLLAGQGSASVRVRAGTTGGQISVEAVSACATSAASTLAVQVTGPAPALGAINGNTAICIGGPQVYSVLPVAGVTTYQWSLPTGWSFVSGQGTNTVTVNTGTTGGTIRVISINACVNNPVPATLAVVVNGTKPARPAAITPTTATPCASQTGLVYSIAAVPGATEYVWSVPPGWAIVSGQGTTTLTATAGATAGNIMVIARNSCGDSDSRTLTVTPTPNNLQVGNVQGPDKPCGNNTLVTYTVMNVTGASSYAWTIPATWTLVSGAGTASVQVRPSQEAGNVSVVVSNSCGSSLTRILAVTPSSITPATPGAIAGPAVVCGTTAGIRYEITPVAGATGYTWSVPTGWNIQSGQGTTVLVVQAGTSGQVSVMATTACGSSAPSTLAVTVGDALGTITQIQNISSPCGGYRFAVEAVPGATSYAWTLPAGWQITAGQGTREIQVTGSGNVPVQLRVEARNSTCTTAPATLTVQPITIAAELMVPNTFSPNNDGKNDVWKVRNLEAFSDNELVVVNRYGGEVHRVKGYRNDWAGAGLAEGTYYYVLKVRLCDNRVETYRGYIMLKR
ncbi:gliding motility-associated C-terminal domain-containing protein [Rufibacter sp. LB8]|uniref:T9SS type B sorting domain-containing protein n=1 Tax=Rufibacter sp. LB8 TaxID=2777781 RepID=UPI00178C277B|nr:gliding motility-associated C-terminal domain-containing protein [Rufibacter sp. LB8]